MLTQIALLWRYWFSSTSEIFIILPSAGEMMIFSFTGISRSGSLKKKKWKMNSANVMKEIISRITESLKWSNVTKKINNIPFTTIVLYPLLFITIKYILSAFTSQRAVYHKVCFGHSKCVHCHILSVVSYHCTIIHSPYQSRLLQDRLIFEHNRYILGRFLMVRQPYSGNSVFKLSRFLIILFIVFSMMVRLYQFKINILFLLDI